MGKYALITGASGGIGSAAARKLAMEGYSLYLHCYTGEEKLQALIKECRELGVDAKGIQADLSSEEGTAGLISKISDEIELLVLNSGTGFYGLMTDIKESEIQKMVYLNVTSPYIITKHLLPSMIRKKAGSIIVISSIWGITGASCEVLYSMVKGGQNSFVKALAKETAPSGIRVNAIAPGAVSTNMLASFSAEEKEALIEEIPLGRLAEPAEIAESIAFLASKKASYITGQILSVNGGWHC
ncbi:elongation factor P 5-aminopentanone reductase [Metabacillus sp. RGM 3146]|uniref:elongation factor P 5-aminopentanone reductase n=1 Tax=Metabacillus sp. RGM 3146 TaxID=3401092 RepID=UPI003B9B7C93